MRNLTPYLLFKVLKQNVVNVASFSYFQKSFSSALSYATSSYKISDRIHSDPLHFHIVEWFSETGTATTTTYATGAENISSLEGYSGEDRIAKVMVDG